MSNKGLLVGCSLGNCVHVAGVANFLRLAESEGFPIRLLGAAVPVAEFVAAVEESRPTAALVGYRLSPQNCRPVLEELRAGLDSIAYEGILIFGGIPDNVAIAREVGEFDYFFVGEERPEELQQVFGWLAGGPRPEPFALTRTQRPPFGQALDQRPPLNDQGLQMPLLRHHFGLPELEATIAGIGTIADADVLDILSLAPDQNAQEFFFRPEQMRRELDGAGGMPVRSEADLERVRDAAQTGNYPYLRIYSGTQDLQKWAELALRTIGNAWGAVPLTWYSELDGRSRRPLEQAIAENMETVRLYARHGIPLEMNESHHWSLRDAPDVVAVAMSTIAGYVAKSCGIRQYIGQFMWNTPRFTAPEQDLAKMLAKVALLRSLEDENFRVYREVRAGLAHFSTHPDRAKGQLGMVTSAMLAINPHILHVVGFPEADHAAQPEEVIESCQITHGVLANLAYGFPDLHSSPSLKKRVEVLLHEASILLQTVIMLGEERGSSDPLADPAVIAEAIGSGLIDAPHLRGQPCALGTVRTMPLLGGCAAVDTAGQPLTERGRLVALAPACGLDPRRIEALQPSLLHVSVEGGETNSSDDDLRLVTRPQAVVAPMLPAGELGAFPESDDP